MVTVTTGYDISKLLIEYFVDAFLDGGQSDGEWKNQRLKFHLNVKQNER